MRLPGYTEPGWVIVVCGHNPNVRAHGLLTLRRGSSPTGSRFLPAAYATSPRRRCPRHWMFFAAFASRSRISPQCVQTCVRTDRPLSTRSPPPEQSWGVDAGWRHFLTILAFKAACAGKRVEAVPPAYTTQDCSGCGERVEKSLSVRTHICTHCGLILDRDENAAKNILWRGQRLRGLVA